MMRRQISTTEPGLPSGRVRAFTVEIHNASSGRGDGYPHLNRRRCPTMHAPSPFEPAAALRTDTVMVINVGTHAHAWPRTHPHRRKPQRFEWPGEADIHMRAIPLVPINAHDLGSRRPGVHAGVGTRSDRASTLTLEIHSAASRFVRRISTLKSALPSIARLHPSGK